MVNEKHTCAEISYLGKEGEPVHSDLCFEGELTEEYREFLKGALDEFLDNFNPNNSSEDQFFHIGH